MRSLFLLFVLVSFFSGCSNDSSGYRVDDPLVQVGDKILSGKDLNRFISNLKALPYGFIEQVDIFFACGFLTFTRVINY